MKPAFVRHAVPCIVIVASIVAVAAVSLNWRHMRASYHARRARSADMDVRTDAVSWLLFRYIEPGISERRFHDLLGDNVRIREGILEITYGTDEVDRDNQTWHVDFRDGEIVRFDPIEYDFYSMRADPEVLGVGGKSGPEEDGVEDAGRTDRSGEASGD